MNAEDGGLRDILVFVYRPTFMTKNRSNVTGRQPCLEVCEEGASMLLAFSWVADKDDVRNKGF
jgi:hypothetical protein